MSSAEIFQIVVDVFTCLAALVAAGSLIVATLSLKQSSRIARKQWNLNAFNYYTNRYEEIMSSFPNSAYRLRFELDQPIQSTEEIRLAVLRYLNMTSEEFYLWKKGYIDQSVWEIWRTEIERTLSTPLFVREWQTLKNEFQSYKEFSDFVEGTQNKMMLLQPRKRP